MTVIIMSRTSFEVNNYTGVTNIAFSSGNIVITHSGGTATVSAATWIVQIINEQEVEK